MSILRAYMKYIVKSHLKNATSYQNPKISGSVFFLIFSPISIFFLSQLIDLSKYYRYDTIHTYSMSICKFYTLYNIKFTIFFTPIGQNMALAFHSVYFRSELICRKYLPIPIYQCKNF